MRRWRRSDRPRPGGEESASSADGATAPEPVGEGLRVDGPFDIAEHPVDADDPTRVHLGALSLRGHAGAELRLQVDEASGQVVAVMVMAPEGAMELRVFAAPRHEDIWDDIRPKLAAEAARRGGTATALEGPYGTALHMVVPATSPTGERGTQVSTVLGIAGPRWLLRATLFGKPAVAYDRDGTVETVLRSVVVDRGNQPKPPGEALPLTLPRGAQPLPPAP